MSLLSSWQRMQVSDLGGGGWSSSETTPTAHRGGGARATTSSLTLQRKCYIIRFPSNSQNLPFSSHYNPLLRSPHLLTPSLLSYMYMILTLSPQTFPPSPSPSPPPPIFFTNFLSTYLPLSLSSSTHPSSLAPMSTSSSSSW